MISHSALCFVIACMWFCYSVKEQNELGDKATLRTWLCVAEGTHQQGGQKGLLWSKLPKLQFYPPVSNILNDVHLYLDLGHSTG